MVVLKFLLFENEDFSWFKILGDCFKTGTLLVKLWVFDKDFEKMILSKNSLCQAVELDKDFKKLLFNKCSLYQTMELDKDFEN